MFKTLRGIIMQSVGLEHIQQKQLGDIKFY
jgi:hypothetical protein